MIRSIFKIDLFRLFLLLLLLLATDLVQAQRDCIDAPIQACAGDCLPVSYIGNASAAASFQWSIDCGTISNPDLRNPHTACFNSTGTCKISVIIQEPGQAPQTCEIQIPVYPHPTVKMIPEDTLCSGDCKNILIQFTGTPPFKFDLEDSTGVNSYLSPGPLFSLNVCPTKTNIYRITALQDVHCSNPNPGPGASLRMTVLPEFRGRIVRNGDTLCAFPSGVDYTWLSCTQPLLFSKSQCFVPPAPGCYMVILDNGLCRDTVQFNFVCTLSCSFNGPDSITVGDSALFYYTGNASINKQLTWILEKGNNTTPDTLRGDSIRVKYDVPGCFQVRLIVRDGPCEARCEKQICVISKPCRCESYNTNYVIPAGSIGNNCCFEIGGAVQSYRCFQSMQIFLNKGRFDNISPNTVGGWSFRSIDAQSFYLTHNSSAIPPGTFKSGNFCVSGASDYTITVLYYSLNNGKMDTCSFQYAFNCKMPSGNPPCDSSFVNYLQRQRSQNNACCWNIQTRNPNANTFVRMEAFLSQGSMTAIPNSAAGFAISNQSVRHFTITHSSGFIPVGNSLPASLCISSSNLPVQLSVRYYYSVTPNVVDSCSFQYEIDCAIPSVPKINCCDSLKTVNLISLGSPNACCFDLNASSTQAQCFSKICVTTGSGVIQNAVPRSGYSLQNISPSSFCFIPNNGNIPSGNINPGSFCVAQAQSPFTITVDFYDPMGKILPSCQKKFVRDCPPPPACSCDSLQVAINAKTNNAGKCCHDISYHLPDNQNKCFISMKLSTSSGIFSMLNCPAGFQLSLINNQKFQVTHSNGYFPMGSQTAASFCVTGSTSYTIRAVFYYTIGNKTDSCSYEQSFNCPPPPPVCSCDSLKSLIIPVSQNNNKCCYDLQMSIPQKNCIQSVRIITSAGTLSSVNADSGFVHNTSNQITNLTHVSGFFPQGTYTPLHFCVTGASSYTITTIFFYENAGKKDSCMWRKQYSCPAPPPSCSCDSLKHDILPVQQNPGYCCYVLSSVIPQSSCFKSIELSISAGTFIQIIPVTGWKSNGGNQQFTLTHNSGLIPAGIYLPVSFCISGATNYILTVKYFYQNGNKTDSCVYSERFDCAPSNKSCSCDSLNTQFISNHSSPDSCCYDLLHDLPQAQCFTKAIVQINSGMFFNALAAAGYLVDTANQQLTLTHSLGYLPSGPTAPLSFCVKGSTQYQLKILYLYGAAGAIDTCEFVQDFDCPSPPVDSSCQEQACDLQNRQWQNIGNVQLIHDMVVYNCKLIVAGTFSQISNNNFQNIAAWDGHQWSSLGTGINGTVRSLAVHRGKLYAGGAFTSAGANANSNGIASWDGTQWKNLDGGVQANNAVPVVSSLLSTSNGLVASGIFDQAGMLNPINTKNIALWNDSAWTQNFNSSFNGPVNGLGMIQGQLVAGGFFSQPHQNISLWDGNQWLAMQNGILVDSTNVGFGVKTLMEYENKLFAGGRYLNASGVPFTQHIAYWDSSAWHALNGGDFSGSYEGLYDLKAFENKLFAAGKFNTAGGNPMAGVAAWDGSAWISTLHPNQMIQAIESYDSCGTQGCALYSAGEGFINRWACINSTDFSNGKQTDIVKIRPNPAGDFLWIDPLETLSQDKIKIQIFRVDGTIAGQWYLVTNVPQVIQIESLQSGTYILEVKAANGFSQRIRVVKM